MQGGTTEQVHKGGQVYVSNQDMGGNPVQKDSAAERTKQPLTDFSELGLDMMQGMQEEIKAIEKQLKDKKAALADSAYTGGAVVRATAAAVCQLREGSRNTWRLSH
jgi:hypothetical protein